MLEKTIVKVWQSKTHHSLLQKQKNQAFFCFISWKKQTEIKRIWLETVILQQHSSGLFNLSQLLMFRSWTLLNATTLTYSTFIQHSSSKLTSENYSKNRSVTMSCSTHKEFNNFWKMWVMDVYLTRYEQHQISVGIYNGAQNVSEWVWLENKNSLKH